MHRVSAAAVALTLAASASIAAERPAIESATPSSFVAKGADSHGDHVLVLEGEHFAPAGVTGYDAGKRIKIFFQAGSIRKQVFMTGWAGTKLICEFDEHTWLQAPGDLLVTVEADGVASAAFRVPVLPYPSQPPAIASISPARFTVGAATTDRDFLFRVRASNLADYNSTSVSIDGVRESIAYMNGQDGVLDAFLPVALREKAGRYPVTIETLSGVSAEAFVEVADVKETFRPGAARSRAAARPSAAPGSQFIRGGGVLASRGGDPTGGLALATVGAEALAGLQPVQGPVVTLTGTVATQAEKDRLEQQARQLPGVAWVNDDLEVSSVPAMRQPVVIRPAPR
jgi:BON domain